MALNSVIFDNTVFNHFARLNSAELIPIIQGVITDKVIIPSQIASELEDFRFSKPEHYKKLTLWIDSISRKRYFEHCSIYDSIVLDFAQKHIDKGEAGAIAQAQKRGLRFFITDEKNCIGFINKNYPQIKTYSSFFLIAAADIHGLLTDYNTTLKEYSTILQYHKMTPKKKKEYKFLIRYEYESAMSIYSLNIDKKLISKKTSIDSIIKGAATTKK